MSAERRKRERLLALSVRSRRPASPRQQQRLFDSIADTKKWTCFCSGLRLWHERNEFQRMQFAAEFADIGVDKFSTGMERMSVGISEAGTDPEGKIGKAFKLARIEAEQVEAAKPEAALMKIVDAIQLITPTHTTRPAWQKKSFGPKIGCEWMGEYPKDDRTIPHDGGRGHPSGVKKCSRWMTLLRE